MGNAEAKEVKNATVTNRSDGEGCNGAREERSGEAYYSTLPCLSEQSKTISFNVLLLCAPQNTTTSRTFTTTKFPESVATLKLAIQEEFQVPVYDQKLSFGSTVMADAESLDFYRLKDGDQITLEFTTTVDVECAFHLMSLLRNALEFVKNEQSQLASGKISPEFSKMISDTLHVKDIDQCINQLMFSAEKILANSDFILRNGGLDVITSLHSLLLKQTWDNICHLDLQYLEKHVLYLLAPLYIVFPHHLKYEVVNSLDNVIGSFLRVPISSKRIAAPQNLNLPDTTRSQQFIVLTDVLFDAVQSLIQITEDEQHQIQIVSNQNVIKQLTGYLISALMKVAERTSSHPIQLEDMDPELCLKLESDLAMYFGVMMISQLALTKAALLPEKLSSQVEFYLTRFLRSVNCSLLRKWIEKTRGMRWPDIFPTVRLVYSPLCRASLCPIDLLCFEAGVCSLHIILSRDNEIQTLIKQGLLDYLICLPWHISEGLEARKKAKLLLEKVSSHMPLQPPSLNNIVRSKLAATCCGLTKAIRYDCHQLVDYCQKTSTGPYKEQIQMDK
ncbi:hypothetical protein EMCRGX_G006952 [Ephydatia muelleri]